MKEDNYFWKYKYQPGRTKKDCIKSKEDIEPLISIITSFYNSYEFFEQTINCVLNQTFQSWEWIIVDDGSSDLKALEYLEQVKKIDKRIKVYHKENEGLALGRDYAIKYSSAKYILPLDADDLIEPTYMEVLFWTLETNPEATWAFTNSVGFGKYIYLSDRKFDSETMKTDNMLTATALIRKNKIIGLGGYGKAKRYVNEDWHLWLRMLANNEFPVQVNYYGFWYRRQEKSLLTEINDEKREVYKKKMHDLQIEADKIKNIVNAKMYSEIDEVLKLDKDKNSNLNYKKIIPLIEKKESLLFILPYFGTDKKIYNKIKKLSKDKSIYIITIQKIKHSTYYMRQRYEQFSTVYDLTTFLDSKYWISFIEYIVKSRKIETIYLSNTMYNEEINLNFKVEEIEKCNDSDIVYKLGILKYFISHSLIIRFCRKILRIIFGKEK